MGFIEDKAKELGVVFKDGRIFDSSESKYAVLISLGFGARS